jgi:hypothetical protein
VNWLDYIDADSYMSIQVNQTKAWLISTFISRRYSSEYHNIEEMGAWYDVTWVWLDRVKITRKGLRGTKRRWRSSNGLETEVPWLRWRREHLHWVKVLIKLGQHYPSHSSTIARTALPLVEQQHRALKSDHWRKGYYLHPFFSQWLSRPFSSLVLR